MVLETPLQIESENAQEFVVIPSLNDFETLSAEDLGSKDEVLVLKHKLVMREGEHNGVFYSWDELKNAIATGEAGSLYYDHDDSASNWVGDVRNLMADDSQKCIFGDLHVVDPVAAKKLRYGAKWGVSPTIDAEKIVRDGQKLALDPKFLSFSLVLRPAVRETMLNSENRIEKEVKSMEEDNRDIEELARKKKKKEEEEMQTENKELRAKVEKYEAEELERKSQEVLSRGSGFGILSENDLDELKELSDKGRTFVSKVIDRVAGTLKLDEDDSEEEEGEEKEDLKENYLKFRARFKKKNPKCTEADVKKAYAKLSEDLMKKKVKKYPYPYPEKKKDEMGEAQDRMKAELADEQAENDRINAETLAFMQEQQR